MATRGTYEFRGKDIATKVIYCHWDNYPSGAAKRFRDALNCKTGELTRYSFSEGRGGWLFNFIRGNVDAEPANRNDRDGHSDTEYHYLVDEDDDCISVFEREAYSSKKWKRTWTGTIADFINHFTEQGIREYVNYLTRDNIDSKCLSFTVGDFVGSVKVKREYVGDITLTATVAKARDYAKGLRKEAKSFDESNPNRKYHLEQAAQWAAVVKAGLAAAKASEEIVSAYKNRNKQAA